MTTDKSALYHSYEDYTTTSRSYDKTRVPLGVALILEILAGGGIPPERACLLDAGCGTGSYLEALREKVGRLEGLEFNAGMLGRARQKLAGVENVVLQEGSVLAMPFPDGHFDAVLFNQVIHHLDDGEGQARAAWGNLIQALAESHRVLRPGGALVINTCTREQVRDGFWYTALIPEATERLARRYVPVEVLGGLLTEAGFDVGRSRVPLDEIFGGKGYFDAGGPFEKEWRDGDSWWSLATEAELRDGLERLRALHEAGGATAFVEERDRLRRAVGQAVFVPAKRR